MAAGFPNTSFYNNKTSHLLHKEPYSPVVPETPSDINFLDADIQICPYHAYDLLREQAPVWKDPITGMYAITRFEDLRNLLLDTKSFTSERYQRGEGAHAHMDLGRAKRMHRLYQEKGWVPAPTLAGRDDPNHRQMRALSRDSFAPPPAILRCTA